MLFFKYIYIYIFIFFNCFFVAIFQKFSEVGDTQASGQQQSRLARVVQLSQQGYSYEAITHIIANEQKKRYLELYAKEEEAQKRAQEKAAAALKSKVVTKYCLLENTCILCLVIIIIYRDSLPTPRRGSQVR